MKKEIVFRAVIEVLGKPKEHVEASLKGYINELKNDEKFKVLKEDFAEIKKQEDQELWADFAEVEVKTESMENLTRFCLNYMPSIIEVIEPQELTLSDTDLSVFLNDLQARLHQIDMVAKEAKIALDNSQINQVKLLKNYISVLLKTHKQLTSEQLSRLTGVAKDALEDYMDKLIDIGTIDLKGETYFYKGEDGKQTQG